VIRNDAPRSGRRRGGEGEAVRTALLEAARRLFAERGYPAVSLRALAAETGSNAAMIHYYFGNKEGLYLAVLREALAPTLERLASLVTAGRHDRAALAELLRSHMGLMHQQPWLVPLVTREVLLREGPLQDAFADQIAAQLRQGLRALTADTPSARAGRPDFAALAVLAMTVFPFIATAMLEKVFRLQPDSEFATHWSEMVAGLVFSEIDAPAEASQGRDNDP
jgi:TetR/AcrR family transcriptional regulator